MIVFNHTRYAGEINSSLITSSGLYSDSNFYLIIGLICFIIVMLYFFPMKTDANKADIVDVIVLGIPTFFLTLGIILFVCGIVKLGMVSR